MGIGMLRRHYRQPAAAAEPTAPVAWGSPAAEEYAAEHGLTLEGLAEAGVAPTGKTGYTKGDLTAHVASLEAAGDQGEPG